MSAIKQFIVIILILIIVPNASAENNTTKISSDSRELLQELGILSSIEFPESGIITRRQGLKIAATIKCHGWYPIYNSQSQIKFLNTYYTDIEDNTDDCNLVVMCTIQEILKGTYDEKGNLIADLDGTLSYRDALTFLNRVLFVDLVQESNARITFGDDWWLEWAKEQGLIRNNSYEQIINMPIITYANQYDAIPADVFLELAYRTLYIPRVINTYGGPLQQYHIEEFILGMAR